MVLPVRFGDGQVVNARVAHAVQTVLVVLPIFISVGAKPVARIIVPFVGKPHRDAIVRKSPKLLDQAIIELLRPFAFEELNDRRSSGYKLRAISPSRVE